MDAPQLAGLGLRHLLCLETHKNWYFTFFPVFGCLSMYVVGFVEVFLGRFFAFARK